MDLVLGLSMTASSVRWVLVEAAREGRTLDRGALPVDHLAGFDADALLSALLDRTAGRVNAIGLNWTMSAEATANAVWQALTDRGVENVIAVSDIEAGEALARGVAEFAGTDRVVVCIAEPDTAVVASVTPEGVTADRVHPSALTDVEDVSPDTVLVAGSGDVSAVVDALRQHSEAAVVLADEADLALARGASLAAESAVSLLDAQTGPRRRAVSPSLAVASVLAAAVVTFVVSLSIALGMTFTPDTEGPQMARSATQPLPESGPPAPAEAAPPAPKSRPAPPPAAPVPAEPVAVAVPDAMPIVVEPPEAPPAPQAPPPVYEEPIAPPPALPEPPAYVPPPPPPNYLPPAPAPAPAYVPPAPAPNVAPPQLNVPQPQPRLRDRIIERIPIINRFHEPEYDYTP